MISIAELIVIAVLTILCIALFKTLFPNNKKKKDERDFNAR